MTTDIIRRLREKLPPEATITEDEDFITFRVLGGKPIVYNVDGVTFEDLTATARRIIETAKAVSFEKEVE